jgi:hypothetical protein
MSRHTLFSCLVLIFLACPLVIKAERKSEIQIRAGGGFAVYGTRSTLSYEFLGFKQTATDQGSAATLHIPLDLRFAFNPRFNIGLDMKFGSYLYDPDSAEGKSNGFSVVGIAAEYSLIARENVRWYLGLCLNSAALETSETNLQTQVTSIANYRGGGWKLSTGALLFFSNRLGVHFQLGLDRHDFDLKEFKQANQVISLENFSGRLETGGIDGLIGLVVRL